jgi:hypothetical protein
MLSAQERLLIQEDHMGNSKLKAEDAGTKRGQKMAQARVRKSKSNVANAEAALRAKGMMS